MTAFRISGLILSVLRSIVMIPLQKIWRYQMTPSVRVRQTRHSVTQVGSRSLLRQSSWPQLATNKQINKKYYWWMSNLRLIPCRLNPTWFEASFSTAKNRSSASSSKSFFWKLKTLKSKIKKEQNRPQSTDIVRNWRL